MGGSASVVASLSSKSAVNYTQHTADSSAAFSNGESSGGDNSSGRIQSISIKYSVHGEANIEELTDNQKRLNLLACILPLFNENEESISQSGFGSPKLMIAVEASPASPATVIFKQSGKSAMNMLEHTHPYDLSLLLRNKNWFASFVVLVEYAPTSVTLMSASKGRPGFPFIYINKHFERETQFKRHEVVGEPNNYFQTPPTGALPAAIQEENKGITILKNALTLREKAMAVVPFTCKNGRVVYNYTAFIPIVDSNGVYTYVIGVHYTMDGTEVTVREKNQVDDMCKHIKAMVNKIK